MECDSDAAVLADPIAATSRHELLVATETFALRNAVLSRSRRFSRLMQSEEVR
jgi:hypothetical protein